MKRNGFITKNPSKIALVSLVLLLILIPTIIPGYFIFLATRIMILSLAAMSMIILAGYGGLLSFAQICFYGITAYAAGICIKNHQLPFMTSFVIAIGLSMIIGAIFAIIAIRTKGNYFIMMTLSFGQLIYLSALQWVEITGGFNGITGIPGPTFLGIRFVGTIPVYYLVLIVVLLCYLALKQIATSSFGLVLQGVRDNSIKMAALGFNPQLHKYLAFIISIFFAAISGLLGLIFYGQVSPNMVTLSSSVMLLFIILIGCITKLEGAFVGALIFVILEDVASKYTQRYMTIIGIFFILVVLFIPDGLLSFQFKKSKVVLSQKTNENVNGL